VYKTAETCVVGIVQIEHVASEWLEIRRYPRLFLTGVQLVLGKAPVLESGEGIVVACDEPSRLTIRKSHRKNRVLSPQLRIKGIRICLE
jgi:hypothetical protein